jgi:replication initiation and membrane attachment protein
VRLGNPLFFTENHRFAVYRDFSLGPADGKMLTVAYQPMVGAAAAGLYLLLMQQLPAERTGWSPLELQRKLFQGLALEPNPDGRALLARCCSLLEAVGLMRTETAENPDTEELVYVYRLYPPLKPADFFATEHLRLLLRDKIGDNAVNALMGELVSDKPEELADPYLIRKEVTVPFYEVFTLAGEADEALDAVRAVSGAAAGIGDGAPLPPVRFTYEQIISRVPRTSLNRRHVELLAGEPDVIARINYYADKYGLTLTNVAEVLDFDGVFDALGKWDERIFERQAELIYLQRYKHEEQLAVRLAAMEETAAASAMPESGAANKTAGFAAGRSPQTAVSAGGHAGSAPETDALLDVPDRLKDKLDIVSYNALLKQKPYTKVLELFIGTPKVMGETKEMFRKLNILYRFPDEVLNALIHYMQVYEKPWNESYINKVAASLQARQVRTYEQAVRYFNAERRAAQGRQETGGRNATRPAGQSRTGGKGKPRLPVYQAPSGKLADDARQELDEIVKYLEGQS